jgi:hypothetical protein
MNKILATTLLLLYPLAGWSLDFSLVNESSWRVGSYENGTKTAPHPVPWSFHSDKTVNAGDLWKGVWQEAEGNKISVTIVMSQNSAKDEFEVNFLNSKEFIAFKNGQPYRWGKRK